MKILMIFFVFALVGFTYLIGFKAGVNTGYQQGYADAIQKTREIQINFVLERMAFYESTYRTKVWGDCDGTRCLAFGLYQFHRATFNWLAHLSANKGLNWKNPEHQRVIASWAIQHGYGHLWSNTYRHALHDYFMASMRDQNVTRIQMRQMSRVNKKSYTSIK